MASKRNARRARSGAARPPHSASRAGKKRLRGVAASVSSLDEIRLLIKQGALREAYAAACAIAAGDPRSWEAHRLIAILLSHAGKGDEAFAAAERSRALAPESAGAQIDLAGAYLMIANNTGFNKERAIEIGQAAIERHGPTENLLFDLSAAQMATDRLPEALETIDLGVERFPDQALFHRNKAFILERLSRHEDAIAAYALSLKPYSLESGNALETIPALRRQYAGLTPGYDDKGIHQSFSERMAQIIVRNVGATAAKRILDAGCGTGLLATRIRAAEWVGIDQSPDMLAKARARNVYAELVEGDLVAMMAKRADRFDLIASSCVLYHFSDLAPFFRESARLLAPGGHLFFSVDPAPDSVDIGITNPGEYAHSRAYLRRLAARNGLAEIAIKIVSHRGAPGFWCAFRRAT